MIAARQIAFGREAKRKPYDAEIEYLESTGMQYILLDKLVVGCDGVFYTTTSNNIYGLVGVWNNGSRSSTILYTTVKSRGWSVRNGENQSPVYSGDLEKDYKHIVVDGVNVRIDENSYEMGAAWVRYFAKDLKSALFGCYNTVTQVVDCYPSRVKNVILSFNDGTMCDLIPVRVGSVGYMYDKVSGKLFGNSGEGDFVLGEDL